VSFDNAVQEISLRKQTLRDLDGIVHHITTLREIKINLSKDFPE
jgi:hypothetical protein